MTWTNTKIKSPILKFHNIKESFMTCGSPVLRKQGVLTRTDSRNGNRLETATLTLKHYFFCQGLDDDGASLSTNMHDGFTWETSC